MLKGKEGSTITCKVKAIKVSLSFTTVDGIKFHLLGCSKTNQYTIKNDDNVIVHQAENLDELYEFAKTLSSWEEFIKRHETRCPEDLASPLGGGAMTPLVERDGKLYSRSTEMYLDDIEEGES